MKILVAYPSRSSFVARDIDILRREHDVVEHQLQSISAEWLVKWSRKILDIDIFLLWFASLRSLPLVRTAHSKHKRLITMVGGYEAANCPEIGYGSARNPVLRRCVRWILTRSSSVVAGSLSSQSEIINNLGIERSRISLIKYGFEVIPRELPNQSADRKSVITVGLISDSTWCRKGVREFVECAERFSDAQFVHVGTTEIDVRKYFGRALPANLTFKGRLSDADLQKEFSRAGVYAQLSFHEGFGCSVAEAMLHGCIPVVTNRFSLPEVVGDTGYLVPYGDIESAAVAIENALNSPFSKQLEVRNRILNEFSLEARAQNLLSLIGNSDR